MRGWWGMPPLTTLTAERLTVSLASCTTLALSFAKLITAPVRSLWGIALADDACRSANQLPQRAIRAYVVDPRVAVRPFLFEHSGLG